MDENGFVLVLGICFQSSSGEEQIKSDIVMIIISQTFSYNEQLPYYSFSQFKICGRPSLLVHNSENMNQCHCIISTIPSSHSMFSSKTHIFQNTTYNSLYFIKVSWRRALVMKCHSKYQNQLPCYVHFITWANSFHSSLQSVSSLHKDIWHVILMRDDWIQRVHTCIRNFEL